MNSDAAIDLDALDPQQRALVRNVMLNVGLDLELQRLTLKDRISEMAAKVASAQRALDSAQAALDSAAEQRDRMLQAMVTQHQEETKKILARSSPPVEKAARQLVQLQEELAGFQAALIDTERALAAKATGGQLP